MSCATKRPVCRWSLLLLVAGWFLLSLFVGEVQLLSFASGAIIPVVVIALTTVLVSAYWFAAPLRQCLDGFAIRTLIAVHLTRLVGIYFLVLHGRGLLPGQFAIPAGWGDIVIACAALLLLIMPGGAKHRKALLAWNTIGLIEILFVVKTAAWIVITNPDSMAVMTRLPLSFLPTMIVPLIILTHVMIFGRLLTKPATNPGVQQMSGKPTSDETRFQGVLTHKTN